MLLQEDTSEKKKYDNAVKWMTMTMLITLVITLILTVYSLPLAFLLEQGVSEETITMVKSFLAAVQDRPSFLFRQYLSWWYKLSAGDGFSLGQWVPTLPFLALPIGLVIGIIYCPYKAKSNILAIDKVNHETSTKVQQTQKTTDETTIKPVKEEFSVIQRITKVS